GSPLSRARRGLLGANVGFVGASR
ncbi:unnamed protein product, partial [Rotaria socialis]